MGGEAVVNGDDVADWDGRAATRRHGDRHVRPRSTCWSTTPASSATACSPTLPRTSGTRSMRVHLQGPLRTARWAAAYWRDRAKAGESVDARIVNTTSGAGLMGSVGQGAYSAAKAGIAALTLVAGGRARTLRRHRQRHRPCGADAHDRGGLRRDDGCAGRAAAFDAMAPENVARSWCGSARPSRPESPAGSSRSRAARSAWPTAGSTAPRSTRARVGSRPTSGTAVARAARRGPAAAPVYGA